MLLALVAAGGWLVGLGGWPGGSSLAAALPTGANDHLFAQRYQIRRELTTTVVGLSTVLGLLTLSAVMLLIAVFPGA